MTLKSDAKVEEKLICCFKNDMTNLVNFDQSTQQFQKSLWFLLYKVLIFDLKKYKRVIFHDPGEWFKIWRKTNLWFENWYGELGKFSPEHSKVSVLRLWWGPYVQSRKCMSLKLTKELWQWQWRMMQNFKRNWLFISNLTWEIWPLGLENIKNLLFNWLLWLKYVMLKLKMYSGGMFDSNENWGKIWRKTDSCFQKWHEKFDKFALAEINE